MQIVDLLSSVVTPGAVLYDLTPRDAGIADHIALPPALGVRVVSKADARLDAGAVVLTCVPPGDDAVAGLFGEPTLGTTGTRVVFAGQPARLISAGALDTAAREGWELVQGVATGHDVYALATIWQPATSSDVTRLRTVNEYRLGKLELIERERELEEARTRLRRTRAGAERLEAELAATKAQLGQLASARDAALASMAAMQQRLKKTRSAVSFRIGRATTLALRDAGRAPWQLPRRWLEAFQGPDDGVDVPVVKPPRRK